jgi:sugar phosphate isomerase/epimerase
MRLGGNIFEKTADPQAWVAAVKRLGYRAAYCPLSDDADDETVRDYAKAAADADIVIAEVGAWSNPIAPDDDARRKSIDKCIRCLDLAERIGARCCVNVAGAPSGTPKKPDAAFVSGDTFDLIVETVRRIVDAVRPTRTRYTLETKPTIFPDSAEGYLDLLEAIDRPGFGVHLDPVNLINSPRRYYDNRRFLIHTIRMLAPHIRSCHVKDVTLTATSRQLVHLDECPPGQGGLDLATYIREAGALDADTPLMIEHLDSAEQFDAAAAHLRTLAEKEGVTL